MLFNGFWPQVTPSNIQIFTDPSTETNTQWATWTKPPNAKMTHIFCLGGGGGGGGGYEVDVGNGRGGGGGGGSASQMSLLIPAEYLPNVLFLQVGAGGAGAVALFDGTIGIPTLVTTYPHTATYNIVLATAPGVGGGGGNSGAGGAGGAAGAIQTVALSNIAGFGQLLSVAGQNGAAGGGINAVGVSITLPSTGILTTGGAGGGGVTTTNRAGGGFNATANAWLSNSRPIAPASGSNNGSGGYTHWKPFFNYGGCGGSSINSGQGGFGGPAAYGGGGGGGGAGTTGGGGGNGGSGIIIITTW